MAFGLRLGPVTLIRLEEADCEDLDSMDCSELEINKGTVPCVQIGNRKAVCGWFIEEQIGKVTVQNKEGTSNEDEIRISS